MGQNLTSVIEKKRGNGFSKSIYRVQGTHEASERKAEDQNVSSMLESDSSIFCSRQK